MPYITGPRAQIKECRTQNECRVNAPIAIFQLKELNIKANSPFFQGARARERAKSRHKLCAERMRSAIVRNNLKLGMILCAEY